MDLLSDLLNEKKYCLITIKLHSNKKFPAPQKIKNTLKGNDDICMWETYIYQKILIREKKIFECSQQERELSYDKNIEVETYLL